MLRTPALPSDAVSRATGAEVVLKLDNLQVTGAFKERGAANRLALLTDAERERGVIAMSAGNHAQAVARHAQLLSNVGATIVMPKFTPATKVTRTAAWGAKVVLHGETLAEAAAHARTLAAERGLVFVHPYDDLGVIAGQGTLALELLQDVPDLDALVIPVGGGGLLAGCAIAATAMKPGIAVYGVEVAAYSAMAQRLAGETVSVGGADHRRGHRRARRRRDAARDHPRPAASKCWWCRNTRSRRRSACWWKAPRWWPKAPAPPASPRCWPIPSASAARRVGVPITGGNIDARILSNVLLRNLLRDGRLLRLHLQIPDRPGVLADIAGKIGDTGGNIIEVSHQRLFAASSVQAAELEVMVEARDPAHADAILEALEQTYVVRRI